jgi:hypothetical protein
LNNLYPILHGRIGAIGEEGTNYTTGAFYQDGTSGTGDDAGKDYFVYMDASRSNPIYKNNADVHTNGVRMVWCIQVQHLVGVEVKLYDIPKELKDLRDSLEFGSMPDFTKMVEMFKLHTGDKWIATLNDVFKINVPGYIYITSSNYNANSDIDSDFIINVSNAAENFYTPQKSANYNPNFARLHKTVDNYAYGGGDSMPFSIIPGKNTWLAFTSWSTTKHVYVYFVPTKYITKHFPEIVPSSYFTNGKIFTNSGNGLTRL